MITADAAASRTRVLEGRPPGTLLIHEIYRSLQGEGAHAGLPCVFVRLTACQLRCVYCDTPHAFNQGAPFTLDAVFNRVSEYGDNLVQITGGEPLLQPEIFPLMRKLADHGKTILLETSGALSVASVDPRVHIVLDLKTPGSGETAANDWTNLDHLKPTDEVKFVVCDRADFEWSIDVIRQYRLHARTSVLFSPAFGAVEPADLAQWVLDTHLPVRMQLQLHKLLWGPNTRGV